MLSYFFIVDLTLGKSYTGVLRKNFNNKLEL